MLWRHREFRKLWIGQTISQIGSRITRQAIPMTAVIVLGASPLEMGLLSGAVAAAVLLFGLFAGAWVDRLRRKPILIGTDLGRAVLLAAIPVAAAMHRLGMPLLYAVAALNGILTVLFDSAYQAYVPSLVDRENILAANSKLAISDSIAEVTGPSAGGVLVQVLTAPIAIAFDACSFLVSAFSLALIRKPETAPEPAAGRQHMLREIAEGLQFCWHNPYLRPTVLRMGTGSFFVGFIMSLYELFTLRELRLSPALLGTVIAAGGVFALLGALFAERIVRRLTYGPAAVGSAIYLGISCLLIPLAHGSVALCTAFLLAAQLGDFGWPVANITEISLRQSVTPAHLLGRVNSAVYLLFRGLVPLGALAGGAFGDLIGVRTTMLIGASGFLLSTVFIVFSPIRRLHELPVTFEATTA
jgi:MFS family permease